MTQVKITIENKQAKEFTLQANSDLRVSSGELITFENLDPPPQYLIEIGQDLAIQIDENTFYFLENFFAPTQAGEQSVAVEINGQIFRPADFQTTVEISFVPNSQMSITESESLDFREMDSLDHNRDPFNLLEPEKDIEGASFENLLPSFLSDQDNGFIPPGSDFSPVSTAPPTTPPTANANSMVLSESTGDQDGNGDSFTAINTNTNILVDDDFSPGVVGLPAITDITYDDSLGTATKETTVAGQITFTANDGTWSLLVLTNGANVGDTTFTQSQPYFHSGAQDLVATGAFTYTIQNSTADTASAVLSASINDDTPTAEDDSATTQINVDVSGNVLINDRIGADNISDISFSVDGANTTTAGSIVISDNGDYTFTPGGSTPGIFTVDYEITDGDGDTSSASLTVTVVSPVTANPDGLGFGEAVGASGGNGSAFQPHSAGSNILNNDDPGAEGYGSPAITSIVYDGALGAATEDTSVAGQITFTADDSVWSVIIITDGGNAGNITFTQSQAYFHTGAQATTAIGGFTYTIQDSVGDTDSATFNFSITDDNPTANDDSDTVANGQGVSGNVLNNDRFGADEVSGVSSIDGGTLNNPVAGNFGSILLQTDGSFTYKANSDTSGLDIFTYTITDGDGDTSSATIQIQVTASNPAPKATPDSITLFETDGDQDSNGSVFMPIKSFVDILTNDDFFGDGAGTPTITNVVYDGSLGVANKDTSTPGVTIFSETTGIWSMIFITDGAAAGSTTFIQSQPYFHTAAQDTTATGTFVYTIQDNDGDTAFAILSASIHDDTPSAIADTNSAALGEVVTGTLFDNDSFGPDNLDSLAINNNAILTNGTVINGNLGTLTIGPDGSYFYQANFTGGTEVFDYEITDGDGDIAFAALTINIAAGLQAFPDNPNNNPNDTILNEADGNQGGGSFTAISISGNMLANDFFGVAGPADPAISSVVYNGALGAASTDLSITGQITFTASNWELVILTSGADAGDYTFSQTANYIHTGAQAENADGSFTYTIQDSLGAATANVLQLRISDDTPTAVDDTILSASDGNARGNLLTNDDFGVDGLASYSVAGSVAPGIAATTLGNLTFSADGSFTFQSNGISGNIIQTYTITDGDGDTSQAQINIIINDAPTAIDDTPGSNPAGMILNESDGDQDNNDSVFTTISVNGNLLTNDSLGGNGPGNPPIVDASYLSGLGTATKNMSVPGQLTFNAIDWSLVLITSGALAGSYTFTQTASYTHLDSQETQANGLFSYTIQDSDGDQSTATAIFQIVDDIPVAISDILNASNGETIIGNVLDNDLFGADGVLGVDSLIGGTLGSPLAGAFGTLTLDTDGSLSYTASSTQSGVDRFDYSIVDADGDVSFAKISINIGNNILIIGTNGNDTNVPFSGVGSLIGSVGNDAIIGDPGGEQLDLTGETINIVYVLDNSRSMYFNVGPGSVPPFNAPNDRIIILKQAVNDANVELNEFVDLGAIINVQIISYDFDARLVGGTITLGGTTDLTPLNDLTTLIDSLSLPAPIGTAYDLALDETQDYFNSITTSGIDITNEIIFISDGEPFPTLSFTNGINNGEWNNILNNPDIAANSIGIGPGVSTTNLDLIDNTGGTALIPDISSAGDLTNELIDIVNAIGGGISGSGGGTPVASVGSDEIDGGDGDDIIFGDVTNTDQFPQTVPGFGGPGTHDSEGYPVLEAFFASVQEIYDYIFDPTNNFENAFLLGTSDRGEADIILGGAGNDLIFAQGGDDFVDGGLGDDSQFGHSGNDTFIFDLVDQGTVDGGDDFDLLDFQGSTNTTLDLTTTTYNGVHQNLEAINLDANNNSLNLSLSDIEDITDFNDTLIVIGGNTDSVTVNGLFDSMTSGVVLAEFPGLIFDSYSSPNATLLVEDEIAFANI